MGDQLQVGPRIRPRDITDFLIVAFVAFPVLIGALFGLPAMVVFLFTGSTGAALLVAAAFYVMFCLFSVSRITLSPEGIRFHRLLGSPRFLAWDRIVSVSEAPRWQLIVRGWLWPPFPAREMTPSFSSVGHYRIQWDSGYCFFPPDQPSDFEHYVRSRLPHPATPPEPPEGAAQTEPV